jgi:purine-nucleoside phosphorylase
VSVLAHQDPKYAPTPSTMAPVSELPLALTSALATIRARVPPNLVSPKVGIVCGSGLSGLGDSIRDKVVVPYGDLEGFGESGGK